jgi:hypothetical protein
VIEASVRELVLKVNIVDCSSTPRRCEPTYEQKHVVALVGLSSLGERPDAPGLPVVVVWVFAALMQFDTSIGDLHWRAFLYPVV